MQGFLVPTRLAIVTFASNRIVAALFAIHTLLGATRRKLQVPEMCRGDAQGTDDTSSLTVLPFTSTRGNSTFCVAKDGPMNRGGCARLLERSTRA